MHAQGRAFPGEAIDLLCEGSGRYTGTVPLKTTLPADIEQRLADLGEAIGRVSPDVEFAYLFGSISAGRSGPRSDLDVAIHVAEGADAHALRLDVALVVARHVGSDAVDVVLLNTAPISVAGRVLLTRRVVLDRVPFARHRYESIVARMFQDFRVREHRLLAQRYGHG